jgi:hypothetical protein
MGKSYRQDAKNDKWRKQKQQKYHKKNKGQKPFTEYPSDFILDKDHMLVDPTE